MNLKQARVAILPAAAIAAGGVTVWLDTLGGTDVDRDDLLPAILTIILGVGAIVQLLLAHFYRKFWRESREVRFEHAVTAIAEGFRAGTEAALGNGQQGKDGRRLSTRH